MQNTSRISLFLLPATVCSLLFTGVSSVSALAPDLVPAPAPTPAPSLLQTRIDRRHLMRENDDEQHSYERQQQDTRNRRRHFYTPSPSPTTKTSPSSSWMTNAAHRQKRAVNDYYSKLSDVWMCLGMALMWTVWMLSNIIKAADHKERYQNDSVLVRGHVLHVSMGEMDSLGTGIPTYMAVIDYMIEKQDQQKSIQIRKHFATQQRLCEGFANVEILVLPEEPTNSVIKEDWEKEMEDDLSETDISLWNRAWCKRLVICLAGVLVLTSVGATVTSVLRLDPLERHWGWISACLGISLLVPAALVVHRGLAAFQRSLKYQSERAGIVIRGPTGMTSGNIFSCDALDVLDTTVCDDVFPSGGSAGHNSPLWRGIPMPGAAGCYSIQFPPKRRDYSKKKKNSNTDDEAATLRRQQRDRQQQSLREQREQSQQEDQQTLERETSSVSISTVSSISLGAHSFLNEGGST
jgi:hypothetical protein